MRAPTGSTVGAAGGTAQPPGDRQECLDQFYGQATKGLLEQRRLGNGLPDITLGILWQILLMLQVFKKWL